MSENDLTDLIYKADSEISTKNRLSETLPEPKKQALWPVWLLILALFASVAWNTSRLQSTSDLVPSQEDEQMSLMMLADSLVTEFRHSGQLPTQLTGPLASEIPVDYLKLNASDFELWLETESGKLILRHEDMQDSISLEPF